VRPIAADVVTLAGVLDVRARDTPEALAFGMGEERLGYRALRDDADRLAAGLLHRGVAPADRVAIVLPAGLDLIRLYFAAQRIGAVPCLFDPSVPAETTARRIARIRPRVVLRDLRELAGSHPLPPLAGHPEDVAFLQPTSGTSGEPRAAVVLQRNALASLQSARALLDPGSHDVLVGWVPPWHDLGLLRFLLGPVYFGVPCYLVPPAVRTIPQWLTTIGKVRGTITGAPDFAYRLATRLVKQADLSSLRYATNGGEPVRWSTISTFERLFGLRHVIRPGYGLAEATLGVTCVRAGEAPRCDERGNVATGRALEGVQVRVALDGEILVRGPAVFAGYFDAEQETSEGLRGGWLHTGDVGNLDAEGNLYVLGRRRAMLKRGGAALAPRELEEAAQLVPGVRIAAAVGIPPAVGSATEEVVVVVETEQHDIATLVAEAVERAIGFAPDRVVVQPPRTIPRTANGKIRHSVLRSQLLGRGSA
jgi:acyl-CoA synthetase (AMP-forming)/AMP-acid ligase II